MKITLKNIGIIKNHEIEIGNFTVVCGKNNTGKTYLSYTVYGLLKHLETHKGNETFSVPEFCEKIHSLFNVNKDEFKDISIEISNYQSENSVSIPFLLPAERTSLQIFQKEIDANRNKLIGELRKTKNLDLIEQNTSRFAEPIEHCIDFIRDYDKITKQNSYLRENHPEILEDIESMLGIKYEIVNGQLMVDVGGKYVPYYAVSTSVRSLADLHLWLKHRAQPNSMLMIDEPEINLHPENQIRLARLFAKLVNAGIKVWLTTHSDYIIKEINNLLLLSNDFDEKQEFMEHFRYQTSEILKPADVKVYITQTDGTIKDVEINRLGLSETTFDETIEQINEVSNSLFNILG